MTDVAVLGCGPAGLLAAHAVRLSGNRCIIFSKKVKSMIHGAQYVHEAIPGLGMSDPDGMLEYVKVGTKCGYAAKVYGDEDAPCSWDSFPEGRLWAWSMHKMYERLWHMYSGLVVERTVGQADLSRLLSQYEMVVSSIPAPALCYHNHDFAKQDVGFIPYTHAEVGDNMIVYNGRPEDNWYRSSRIFGHEQTETTDPKAETIFTGVKPLGHNCDCRQTVVRVGRFGRWEKGVLVHHAFEDTLKALEVDRALLQV